MRKFLSEFPKKGPLLNFFLAFVAILIAEQNFSMYVYSITYYSTVLILKINGII